MDKEKKAEVLKEIADMAKGLMADKIKGKKPVEMQVEVSAAAVPEKKMSKEELKEKLGIS